MRKELEQKLAEKYPFMRHQHTLAQQEAQGFIYDLYSAFGCECSDGWYDLLDHLCEEIAQAYEAAGVPVNIVVDQVKEKYGTLRFYYHFSRQTPSIQTVEQGTIRLKQDDSTLYQHMDAIVSKWEARSGSVCEMCGNAGEPRTDLLWILTLCDQCYQKQKTRRC